MKPKRVWATLIVLAALCGCSDPSAPAGTLSGDVSKPRFFLVESVEILDGKARTTVQKMCNPGINAKALDRLSHDPKAMAELKEWQTRLTKGCTIRQEQAQDSYHFEETCDGRFGPSHSETWSSAKDIRTRSESIVWRGAPGGADVVMGGFEHMTYLGDCPANVKPGQILQSDGKVFDVFAPGKPSR